MAIGPGLGRSTSVVAFVQGLLGELREMPVVLDADGLFADIAFYRANMRIAPSRSSSRPIPASLPGSPVANRPATDPERIEQATAFAQQYRLRAVAQGGRDARCR